jgi:pyruvate dehydrogenase E1 component alpha subunit
MAETKTRKKGAKKGASKKDVFSQHGIGPDLALELLREMLLYRRFEEKAEEGYAIGKIGGFCHLHIGQEGAAAGSIRPLRNEDYVISAYREHTQALAKGVKPGPVMAELYGRAGGASGGKGGSMHIFDRSVRFMGGHGIVGGQVPLAAGFAWKIKYRGEDNVVVCFMGDAAVNQGAFHEALNMAAVWELPVIFVVENNEYGMGTAFHRFRDLAAEVREGGGPRFVDLQTYRFRGHSMSDPVSGTYRPKEEVEHHVKEEDPIGILRDHLIAAGHLEQAGLESMDVEARQVVEEAAEFADSSPAPEAEALYSNVWAEINPHGRLFFDGREDSPWR